MGKALYLENGKIYVGDITDILSANRNTTNGATFEHLGIFPEAQSILLTVLSGSRHLNDKHIASIKSIAPEKQTQNLLEGLEKLKNLEALPT